MTEGWETRALGQVATLQRGFDLPSRLRRSGSVPVVSSSGVSGWHDRATVSAPGVVTGRYGTIGLVFFEERDFWPLNTTLWVSNFHGNDERFVYYILQLVDFATHSGKSGVPGVNRNDVHSEIVAIPVDREEQRTIAAALSDADRLIATLTRLLAKKQAIKQGLMQELLTGRTRLPGFEGEWRLQGLSELAAIVSGGTPSSLVAAYWNGGIPWCTPTDITAEPGRYLRQTERTISDAGLQSSSATLLPAGSLLLCTRATIGELKIARTPTATNQGFKSLAPRATTSSEFLYYKMLVSKARLFEKGTGSTFLEVSKRDVAALKLDMPPTVEEQQTIAQVLTDADDELAALRARLNKAKAIKQGMIQELLTGRTRLPGPEQNVDAEAEAA